MLIFLGGGGGLRAWKWSLDVDKMSVLLGLNGISSSYSKLIYTGTYQNNCFLAFIWIFVEKETLLWPMFFLEFIISSFHDFDLFFLNKNSIQEKEL